MLKRLGTLLIVVATMPLIIGGGGMGPPQQASRKTTGPAITATVVMDPHMSGTTSTAKRATIRLQKGGLASSATFDIPANFVLDRGCDLNLTDLRFVYTQTRANTLYNWVPGNPFMNPPGDVVSALFAPLGITPDPSTNVPVITDIDNAVCTADANVNNQGVTDSGHTYEAQGTCPDGNPCSNQNNQKILISSGDGRPSLAGILSFTALIQFEVAH